MPFALWACIEINGAAKGKTCIKFLSMPFCLLGLSKKLLGSLHACIKHAIDAHSHSRYRIEHSELAYCKNVFFVVQTLAKKWHCRKK